MDRAGGKQRPAYPIQQALGVAVHTGSVRWLGYTCGDGEVAVLHETDVVEPGKALWADGTETGVG